MKGPVPAPQLHLSFANSVSKSLGVRAQLRLACAAEPAYTRLGAIVHDLPYYGNMLVEAIRYGLRGTPLDEPWAYRMHSVRPARFVASFLRAAARAELGRSERLALASGLLSHCALDLSLHPLVNFCARRDAARFGGHESVHHRNAEKMQALFFHLEQLGEDPIGTPLFREWTCVTKEGSLVRARVEAPLVALVRDAYQGAYGGAPPPATWCRWVRSFRHFGALVSAPWAARNSRRVRKSAELRERYYENETFRFTEFYACAEARLVELCNLGFAYLDAGDFSRRAEDAFVAASGIDDLAEPEPAQSLPELPRLPVVSTPGLSRPAPIVTAGLTASVDDPPRRHYSKGA
jgi:hypothetical protein